ncbi:MAG TPA: hypothetical protein V6D11_16585 [Waterburya sp.]|jgi:hypothetical protein
MYNNPESFTAGYYFAKAVEELEQRYYRGDESALEELVRLYRFYWLIQGYFVSILGFVLAFSLKGCLPGITVGVTVLILSIIFVNYRSQKKIMQLKTLNEIQKEERNE